MACPYSAIPIMTCPYSSPGLTEATDQTTPQSGDERRLWRRFRQLITLPEKDRRAVMRMLDTMTKAQQTTKGKNSAA